MNKTTLFLSSFLLFATAITGCADQAARQNDTYPGTVRSESTYDLENTIPCDVETVCPENSECLFINAFELDTAICADPIEVCDALDCGEGECLILESYPGQVACSSPPSADDLPGDDDNCTVSSDGTTACPDDSDNGEGSTPGNEGPAN